jgi:hypothetical protein
LASDRSMRRERLLTPLILRRERLLTPLIDPFDPEKLFRAMARSRLICSWKESSDRMPNLALVEPNRKGVQRCVHYPEFFSRSGSS